MKDNKKTPAAKEEKAASKASETACEEKGSAPTASIQFTAEEFEKLKAHIETLQKERDETVLLAQRLQADFDNFRKRNASVHLESREEGIRSAIVELLPILDGFDRAFENIPENADASWADGIKLLHKQLLDGLSKMGFEEIPTDSGFDPEMHEAVMQVEDSDKNSGDIVEVYRKGYKVKDRIIRHSMVTVAK